jgi:DNA primase
VRCVTRPRPLLRGGSAWLERDIRCIVCDDVESLLYVTNLGSIPIHIWNSRVGTLEPLDWCVLHVDPKEARFAMWCARHARSTRCATRSAYQTI